MVLAKVEEQSVHDDGKMGDARVDSHQGWKDHPRGQAARNLAFLIQP